MGRFAKIFLLSEDQMKEYKPFYDFSMELYEQNAKDAMSLNQNLYSYQNNKTSKDQFILYNNYFGENISNVSTVGSKK